MASIAAISTAPPRRTRAGQWQDALFRRVTAAFAALVLVVLVSIVVALAFAAWPALAAQAYRLPDDVAGIARTLYAALRDLDAAGVAVVIAALPPAVGLGEAVGDRLRRAAGPRGSRRNPS
jgi:ABC-type phosphate transport system permease subunit